MLRRDQLCPGPRECPYAYDENPFDHDARCGDCPLTLLESYLGSACGQLIERTLDLDFALRAGVTVSLSEITYPEFLLLRFLAEERARFNEELMNDARR